jgi:ferritin-like metal-binding protein YciE
MADRTIQEQLVKYLTDVHSIEEQALVQMRSAPDMAGDDELAAAFRDHEVETAEQERRVRDRLDAHDATPNRLKDLAGAVTGKGFVLFARSQPDTPGKLAAHAYSYEHMELAAYELLERVARRAGDEETATMARSIAGQEAAMAKRIEALFERAVDASLRAKNVDATNIEDHLVKYLTDAHAIENQAIELLERGTKIAGDPELARIYSEHLAQTRAQQASVKSRLDAHEASPNKLQDAAMRLGALNWGGFFAAQPDTPAKLAGFSFAFEHLEIGGYEQLAHVARRAGDQATVDMAQRILEEERTAARRIAETWDRTVDASLQAVGATA